MSDLINRLRGTYTVPINDGAGPIDGKMTVTRTFDKLPPIMGEAANELERLQIALDSYNLGGWVGSMPPAERALKAEAVIAELLEALKLMTENADALCRTLQAVDDGNGTILSQRQTLAINSDKARAAIAKATA